MQLCIDVTGITQNDLCSGKPLSTTVTWRKWHSIRNEIAIFVKSVSTYLCSMIKQLKRNCNINKLTKYINISILKYSMAVQDDRSKSRIFQYFLFNWKANCQLALFDWSRLFWIRFYENHPYTDLTLSFCLQLNMFIVLITSYL